MKIAYLTLFLLVYGAPIFAQDLYDIGHITEIHISFDDPNWDATMDTYYDNDQDELLFATVTINGVQYDSVGVAYKGNSTYNPNNLKNPLKIKLAEVYGFQEYHGCQTLKLSNGNKDPSFVREVLSYEIGRKYMDMPLSNYAKVYVNGNYYGLFSSSESVNGDYMESRFYCNRDNVRVKCNPEYGQGSSSLAYLGADSSLYYSSYEMKSDYGWAELTDLCYQLEFNTNNIESYLYVDAALWMLAFDNVLVNLDSYIGPLTQNYYLIQDDNGRFIPVIWDLNQSIGSFAMLSTGGGGGPPSPTTLSDLTDMDPYLRENDSDFPLVYFLFQNNRYKKMYIAHCKTILEENILNGDYYTRAQELQDIIDVEVQSEPNGFYTHAQFTANLDAQQGGGMGGGTYGLSEVMDNRATYLNSHAAFNYVQPTITNISMNPAMPSANTTVSCNVDIQDANYAYFAYRFYQADAFTKIELFDDGLHNDGAAGDGVWGADFLVQGHDCQYYIYAENANAGKFSPERAEHEFYTLTLQADVVINELQSSNIITAQDDYFEYNDWVELYNTSSNAVDLSGYFLSDDPLNLYKWEFPFGTTIDPGEYLIVWCDNDGQAGLHANFKLTSNGETLYFSDDVGSLISAVTYPEVHDNHTYGRYPNGTGGFIPMMATHAAENSFTYLELEENSFNLVLYPNPASEFVEIQTDLPNASFEVLDASGRILIESSETTINIHDLSKGVYFLRATNGNAESTYKFIKT